MLHTDHITLGVCYYPEHWPQEMWADDLKRMKECGIEIIRVAEFAWNKFEPKEGIYTFEFFDSFLELAVQENMKVIFCTPTATPPIWLSEKYPEILNADIDGNLYYHGTRRHNNLNSPIYREFSRKITEKLAEHYCKHPNVIGWQLDNEINCEQDVYYSESDHKAFREYCKNKFGTLDNFNETMGTMFWNQSYTDWTQVHLTRRTNTYRETNLHIQLEELRFISASAISFFKEQADIIRNYAHHYGRDDQFITTNGLFRHIDYQKLVGEVLDFITYDNYPAFAFETWLNPEHTNGLKDRNTSFNLTRARSISPIFGIMEQQTGAGGWNCRMMMPMPKPGQMRLWTIQAIAHGADYIGYFRWRTATFGTEIYWHGLNDYSNSDNRRIRELKQTFVDVSKIRVLAGAKYQAQVSILMDYDNDWDGEHDIWHGQTDPKSRDAWFCTLQKNHVPFDFTFINDETKPEELVAYKVLIYPHATIFTKKRKELLESYIRQGGTVIFGCRTGYKDIHGQCHRMELPGYAGELCGCKVEEYTPLSQFDEPVRICTIDNMIASAPMFHDVLMPTDGEVMASFDGAHYSGKPAIVRKQIGAGYGWYVGSVFAEDTAEMLAKMTGIAMPEEYRACLTLPQEVEFAVRKKEDCEMIFLLNYEKTPTVVTISDCENVVFRNALSGEKLCGKIEICGYDCLILERMNERPTKRTPF
ncbi:MAG: beta-galactosidase [Lachnospiraceae bacterium]|nr:beta-galactosidase [Lachnospiraceae bacterium]